jgi:hypothetical protein
MRDDPGGPQWISMSQPHDRRIRAIPDSRINQTYIYNSLIIHLGKAIASAD